MKAKDILLQHPRWRVGYVPQSVAQTPLNRKDMDELGYHRLLKIPSKIAAYFDRSKIVAAWNSRHMPRPEDNYYVLQATDGTFFHVEY